MQHLSSWLGDHLPISRRCFQPVDYWVLPVFGFTAYLIRPPTSVGRDSCYGSVVPTTSLTRLSVLTGFRADKSAGGRSVLRLRLPCDFGRLDKDFGPLPIVCLFLPSTFYCWTSRLSCCWCIVMERFCLHVTYLLAVATNVMLTFKQRHKNALISSVPPCSYRLTVHSILCKLCFLCAP